MSRRRFILASASPRRSELLRSAGVEFDLLTSDVEEVEGGHLVGRELAQLNAYRKSRAVAKKHPNAVVLGADTVVCLGARIFGKPRDMRGARAMLRELSGETHEVVSGCCLIHVDSNRYEIFYESTLVTFRELGRKQIQGYLESIQPLDKAGAYAIQDHGEAIVESVHGSLTNVVGLPLAAVLRRLPEFGVRV